MNKQPVETWNNPRNNQNQEENPREKVRVHMFLVSLFLIRFSCFVNLMCFLFRFNGLISTLLLSFVGENEFRFVSESYENIHECSRKSRV